LGREIERKFLPRDDGWRANVIRSVGIRQAYLASTERLSIRVRVREDGTAFLTIKSAEKGVSRAEFEYPLPTDDAEELISIAGVRVLEKRRYDVLEGGRRWEVDEFAGRHQGLVIAEIELESPDAELPLPSWAGREVTDDRDYNNEALARS
jgi:adenylate cyclase